MSRRKKKKEQPPIHITDHATQRAKERLSFTPKVLEKMALRAFEAGIKHGETKGFLHKYVDKIWLAEGTANNVRIYGEVIYLFADTTLVTIYQMPPTLKKLAKVSKQALNTPPFLA